MYSVQCTVYSAQCTVFTVQFDRSTVYLPYTHFGNKKYISHNRRHESFFKSIISKILEFPHLMGGYTYVLYSMYRQQ